VPEAYARHHRRGLPELLSPSMANTNLGTMSSPHAELTGLIHDSRPWTSWTGRPPMAPKARRQIKGQQDLQLVSAQTVGRSSLQQCVQDRVVPHTQNGLTIPAPMRCSRCSTSRTIPRQVRPKRHKTAIKTDVFPCNFGRKLLALSGA